MDGYELWKLDIGYADEAGVIWWEPPIYQGSEYIARYNLGSIGQQMVSKHPTWYPHLIDGENDLRMQVALADGRLITKARVKLIRLNLDWDRIPDDLEHNSFYVAGYFNQLVARENVMLVRRQQFHLATVG